MSQRISSPLRFSVARALRASASTFASPWRRCKSTEVYTDGSCFNAGRPDAIAGYGIYFGLADSRNESGMLPRPPFDSMRSELYAAMRAIVVYRRGLPEAQSPANSLPVLRVHTDCMEIVKHVQEHAGQCVASDWTLGSKFLLRNRDIVEPVARILCAEGAKRVLRVEWVWVRAHSGVAGNERAHAMATAVVRRERMARRFERMNAWV